MCFPLSVSRRAGVRHRAAASLICCLSLPGTQERPTRARLSHFACAHSLSMKKRCSISLPAKWTACEMADLAGAWIPSLACRVSSMQKKRKTKNAVQGVFSVCGW